MKHDLKIILAIVGIVVALVIFFQVKACITEQNITKISKLEGELSALTAAAEKEKKENLIALQEMEEEIGQLAAEIQEKNTTIIDLQKEDEEIVPTEIIDEPGEGQDWEMIAGINAQSAREWEDKYWASQKIIKELGVPIPIGIDPVTGEELYRYPHGSVTYNLYAQYLLAADQRDKYKAMWETAENLLRIADEVNTQKDKKIARLKLGKTAERFITYPLAIFGGFKIGQAIFGGL